VSATGVQIPALNTSIEVKYQRVEVWSRIARTSRPLKKVVLFPEELGTAMGQGVCSTYISGEGSLRLVDLSTSDGIIIAESRRISKRFLCSFQDIDIATALDRNVARSSALVFATRPYVS
jgi:hypothetical protein